MKIDVSSKGFKFWNVRKDEVKNKKLLELLDEDYIPTDLYNNGLFFEKREYFPTYPLTNTQCYNGVYYNLSAPLKFHESPKRMVVIFSALPSADGLNSPQVDKRYLINSFSNKRVMLEEELIILRIYDINRLHGSFYLNTSNFSDYEQQVISLIKKQIANFGVKDKNVVLLGSFKGATASLYYSSIMNLKSISCDPVIDISVFLKDNDFMCLLDSLHSTSILDVVNSNKSNDRLIFCSESIEQSYKDIVKLKDVELIKVECANRKDFIKTIEVEVFAMLNYLLNSDDFILN